MRRTSFHRAIARLFIGKDSRLTARQALPAMLEPLESRAHFSVAEPVSLLWTAVPLTTVTTAAIALAQPAVRTINPASGAIGVSCAAAITADLKIPNGAVDVSTLTSSAIYLCRASDGVHVAATINTSGGGDVIVLKPSKALAAHTKYTFKVTSGARDIQGVAFTAFSSSFTTGAATAAASTPVKFKQLPQTAGAGRNYFCLTTGPDGRLYAGADNGNIYRFDIKSDGTLSTPTVISAVRQNNGNVARFIVGLAFAPGSTANNPTLWVSHTGTSSLVRGGTEGHNWTSKVSLLTSAKLSTYRDAVVNLPRSVRDHFTMQLAFGPDGALYFGQASQSAMGRADLIWGNRSETLLSGAILRLDTKALGTGTLDAKTKDAGGTYDPAAAGASLTVYAEGVRNAFDLLWHSNGKLYAPANGSAAGGNTPAGPTGSGVPALTNVAKAETDALFRIDKGGYYGHPNPRRGFHVLNGGNPTSTVDPFEVTDYPVGLKPDARWRKPAYDFGLHQAPAGVIEYRGGTFGGALDRAMLVCRYSAGDDIIVLSVGADGVVTRAQTGLPGLTGLADPVDIVQRPGGLAGLYVIELAKQRINFLKMA